jgi:zinc/manganese transport system substrate-binding protein
VKLRYVSFFLFLLFSGNSFATLKVVTTTPDLAWLVSKIGQEHVEVESLLTGSEDPHFVDVVPAFISKVMRADIVCSVGLDLEIGWLPRVLSRSARSHLQSGGKGLCVTGEAVSVLEKIEGRVDRSMGDVHSAGNPHFSLGPTYFGQAGQAVLEALIRNNPAQEEAFRKNYQTLIGDLKKLREELRHKLHSSKSKVSLMEYHKDFTYFFHDYGLNSHGAIEEVPGVPPAAGRIASLSAEAKNNEVRLVLASHVSPVRVLTRFCSLVGCSYIQLPTMMTVSGPFSDYFNLQRWLVDEILKHAP